VLLAERHRLDARYATENASEAAAAAQLAMSEAVTAALLQRAHAAHTAVWVVAEATVAAAVRALSPVTPGRVCSRRDRSGPYVRSGCPQCVVGDSHGSRRAWVWCSTPPSRHVEFRGSPSCPH
jgi:hypothetical protein